MYLYPHIALNPQKGGVAGKPDLCLTAETVAPASLAIRFSILGIGYLSSFAALLSVSLKSP